MIRSNLDSIFRRPSLDGDIFIFTMPRSGMTWLLEMFNTISYTRCVQEPMNSSWIPLIKKYFKPRRRYIDLDQVELDGITEYLKDIQSNRQLRMGYNFLRGRKLRTTLNVVALARVSNLAGRIEDKLNIRPMVLIRHPISNSLSRFRNKWHLMPRFGETGWDQFINIYLESEMFKSKYLLDNLTEECFKIRQEGNILEKYVLSWCLDNIAVLGMARDRHWLIVCYEDLIQKPEWTITQITEHYSLRKTSSMISRVGIPSKSSHLSQADTVKAIRDTTRAKQVVSRWRNEVDKEVANKCFHILDLFGIYLYKIDSDMPDESWINFRTAHNPISHTVENPL